MKAWFVMCISIETKLWHRQQTRYGPITELQICGLEYISNYWKNFHPLVICNFTFLFWSFGAFIWSTGTSIYCANSYLFNQSCFVWRRLKYTEISQSWSLISSRIIQDVFSHYLSVPNNEEESYLGLWVKLQLFCCRKVVKSETLLSNLHLFFSWLFEGFNFFWFG